MPLSGKKKRLLELIAQTNPRAHSSPNLKPTEVARAFREAGANIDEAGNLVTIRIGTHAVALQSGNRGRGHSHHIHANSALIAAAQYALENQKNSGTHDGISELT